MCKKWFCFAIPYAFPRCNLFLLTATFPPLTLSSRISKVLDEAQFSCHYLWPLNSQQLLFFSIFNVLRLWLRIEWTEWWNVPDSCHRLPPLHTTTKDWKGMSRALSSVQKVVHFFDTHHTLTKNLCVKNFWTSYCSVNGFFFFCETYVFYDKYNLG